MQLESVIMSQGMKANISGTRLEKRVELLFDEYELSFIKQHKYTNIYNNNARMDFYLESKDLAVECKNQEVSGSVAEKIPYVMEAFLQHPAKNGLLILGGAYWPKKPGIRKWAETRANQYLNKNVKIIYEKELEKWIEQTGIK